MLIVQLLLLTIGFASLSYAHFNLYMNSTETKRLLGISDELYYVRNSVVNEYALQFNLPINPEISDIYFIWNGLQHPSQGSLIYYYSIAVSISNAQAMIAPTINVPREGEVPNKLSILKITLHCSGVQAAEVDVRISLNVSVFSSSANKTRIEIKRKKTCLRDETLNRVLPNNRIVENWKIATTSEAVNTDGNSLLVLTSDDHTFYVAIGSTSAAIVFIAFIVAVYFVCMKRTEQEHFSDTSSALSHEHTGLRTDTSNRSNTSGKDSGISSKRICGLPYEISCKELKPEDVISNLMEIAVECRTLTITELLLQGKFGRIYVGSMLVNGKHSNAWRQPVFVKTVSEEADSSHVTAMLKDGLLTKNMRHSNISSLLAVCLKSEQQKEISLKSDQESNRQIDDLDRLTMPMLIYPFMNDGNLKLYLIRCQDADCNVYQILSTPQLVSIALQLAHAVQYMHQKHILHKDISTRNCLVDPSLTVRLTDSSLSPDMFPDDYHCLGDAVSRPVKWLALETLQNGQFSIASDAWSFGVTLWELMTFGQQPYANVEPSAMVQYLASGYRLLQPVDCPNEIFALMTFCWSPDPENRPRFSQLIGSLKELYTALGQFV